MKLRIIKELYGEGTGEEIPDRSGEQRPDLEKEFEELRLTKAALDARPKRRPDARTVDAVIQAASAAAAATNSGGIQGYGRRRDRAPLARRPLHLRSAGVATAVVVLFMGLMSVWYSDVLFVKPQTHKDVPIASAESDAMGVEGKSESNSTGKSEGNSVGQSADVGTESTGTVARASSPAAVAPSASGETNVGESEPTETELRRANAVSEASSLADHDGADHVLSWDGRLAWDPSGDIMEVSQDIEMIQGGVALDWDPPSVPLEMIPASGQDNDRPTHFLPAGAQRLP